MYQVKKKIISAILIVSALLMVAGVSVVGVYATIINQTVVGFSAPITYQGAASTFSSLTQSASTISHVSGYSSNSKYASCASHRLDGTVYVQQDAAYSGHVNDEIANSANDHFILVNDLTDKIVYYGHLRIAAAHNTAFKDRYWLTRYKNSDLASLDDSPQFSYIYMGEI